MTTPDLGINEQALLLVRRRIDQRDKELTLRLRPTLAVGGRDREVAVLGELTVEDVGEGGEEGAQPEVALLELRERILIADARCLQESVAISGNQWLSTVISGTCLQEVPVAIRDHQWQSVAIHGHQ